MKTEKNAHLYDYCDALQAMIDDAWEEELAFSRKAREAGKLNKWAEAKDADLNAYGRCVQRQALVRAKDVFITMHKGEF